jgi:hypothetical protein
MTHLPDLNNEDLTQKSVLTFSLVCSQMRYKRTTPAVANHTSAQFGLQQFVDAS